MPRVTGKEMIRFLVRRNFSLYRVKGSHHLMRNGEAQTVIPIHGNQDLKTGTLRGILRDINMEPEEFERLWHH
ncbi:type II toxin-antitoxin system HicA family toxin [Candidatus Peregrinibacteria bacterium]|nr:type II toxin-antitoxin system HicA family toxin [Candidatus Peregrinibacteria bacterium]